MKKIALTQGLFALVDDADFEWLNQWKWKVHRNKFGLYAGREEAEKLVLMHRLIMNASDKFEVDHRNRNGLDNQRVNLRLATRSQNMANRRLFSNNTSGYRGVYAAAGKYRSTIRVKGKTRHLGYFESARLAAKAYNRAAIKAFGEFATLNVVV